MKTKVQYYFYANSAEYKTQDIELQLMLTNDVDVKVYKKEEKPDLFNIDIAFFAPDLAQHPTFRQPSSINSSVDNQKKLIAFHEVIQNSGFVYVLTNIKEEPADTGYWDAFYDLLADMVHELNGGVFFDTISKIIYAAADVHLAWNDFYGVREFVALNEIDNGNTIDIYTIGMNKFSGQKDLIIKNFPKQYIELGRRLLYDNLCAYVFKSGKRLEAGQNMQYKGDDSAAKWFFSEDAESRLLVSDGHPDKKEKIEGLTKYLSIVGPMWDNKYKAEYEEYFKEAEINNKEQEKQNIANGKINTLQEYVDFMVMLEKGQMENAMKKYGLTYETLDSETNLWSEKMNDDKLSLEFAKLREKLMSN